jgi:hypothetical protein
VDRGPSVAVETSTRRFTPRPARRAPTTFDVAAADPSTVQTTSSRIGERRALIRPHAVNAAVLHARVFGPEPLARQTVIASFVEGARVRADALATLTDVIGGESLGREVRRLLVDHPPPMGAEGPNVVSALRATYAAHERRRGHDRREPR